MNTKKKIAVSLVSAVSSGVILALGAVIFLLADAFAKGHYFSGSFFAYSYGKFRSFPDKFKRAVYQRLVLLSFDPCRSACNGLPCRACR